MVMNFLYPGNIFGGHDGCLPQPLFGYDAAQVDDTVAHRDAEAERAPSVLLERIDNAVPNMVVVSGRVGNFARQAGDGLKEIGA